MNVRIKRIYTVPGPEDGFRVLVDRLWPRGVSKTRACIDASWKECSPSSELRTWFGHDPSKWDQFRKRYTEELKANREEVAHLVNLARPGPITLVYAAKDDFHNHALVLKDFIETQILAPGVE